jgi:hypothetical protein
MNAKTSTGAAGLTRLAARFRPPASQRHRADCRRAERLPGRRVRRGGRTGGDEGGSWVHRADRRRPDLGNVGFIGVRS